MTFRMGENDTSPGAVLDLDGWSTLMTIPSSPCLTLMVGALC